MAKRLHKEQNLELKYEALLELEKGKTNKEVAQLFGLPANTLSTWKKNKDKIFQAFQQGSATTKRVNVDTYDQVGKVVLKWFKGSENVSVNSALIQAKALYFAKGLAFENFEVSDGWFNLFYFRLFYYVITAI